MEWDTISAAILSSILTGIVLHLRQVPSVVATHDRLTRYAREDLRRWIQDRDRAAEADYDQKLQAAHAAGASSGGFPAASRGKIFTHVLHEYRDRALDARRDFDELEDREGYLHRIYRKLRNRPLRRLALPIGCIEILTKWRSTAHTDVSSIEPILEEIESVIAT